MPIKWARFELISPKIWTHIILTTKAHHVSALWEYCYAIINGQNCFQQAIHVVERYRFFGKVSFFTKKCSSQIWLHPHCNFFLEFYMCPLPMTHLFLTCGSCADVRHAVCVGRENQDYHYWPGAALTLTVIKIGFQMSFETVYVYKLSHFWSHLLKWH